MKSATHKSKYLNFHQKSQTVQPKSFFDDYPDPINITVEQDSTKIKPKNENRGRQNRSKQSSKSIHKSKRGLSDAE